MALNLDILGVRRDKIFKANPPRSLAYNPYPSRVASMTKQKGSGQPKVKCNDYLMECVVPSCSRLEEHDTVTAAITRGWRNVKIADHDPANTNRTHLGFCPACAKEFGCC